MNRSLDLALVYSRQKRRLPSDLHTGKLGRRTIVVPPPKRTRRADGGDIGDVGDVDSEEGGQDLEATQVDPGIQRTQCEDLGHSVAEQRDEQAEQRQRDEQNPSGHEQESDSEVRH
jgi:hypothetical protein